ncbi:MAG TPA: response regulator transcription factor [Dehalococcoidia bacterium]|jgi:DNA-binding NarL/FixJ family response regulator|nr:response regulator transcription factor [Dehalococcoidia bacterium]
MTELRAEVDPAQGQPDTITIMLADDHPLLRQALRNVLEKQADFKIIAEAGDGEEAVKLATELVPDVVIMDIGMPKLNGLEATRQIKEKCPRIAILVLTVHDDSEHILGILEAGAAGYLTKSVFGDEVVCAVRGVAAGETVLSPSISQRIIKHALRHIAKPLPLDVGEKITSRELDILRLAAKGLSNKDISLKLDLSLRTVKGHLSEIFSKLNAGSRTEAVITALRAGILTIDDLN